MIPLPAPAALVAPAPVPAAIRFAPPLAHPIRVETVELRTRDGQAQRFWMLHEVRFARLGAGWRMDATMLRAGADALPAPKAVYDAAMRPFAGVTTSVAVSAAGKPVGALDADAAWAKVMAGQRAAAETLAAQPDVPPATAAAIRAHFASFGTLAPAERDAMLTAFAWDLLGLTAPALRPGESQPYSGTTDAPGAGPITERGTTRYVSASATEAVFALDAEVDPTELAQAATALTARLSGQPVAAREDMRAAAERIRTMRVRRHDDYVVDRATGLTTRFATRRKIVAGGVTQDLVERTVRILP